MTRAVPADAHGAQTRRSGGSEVAALSEVLRAEAYVAEGTGAQWRQAAGVVCALLDQAARNAQASQRRSDRRAELQSEILESGPTAEPRGRRLAGLMARALGDEPDLRPQVAATMEWLRQCDLAQLPEPVAAPPGSNPSSAIPPQTMTRYLRAREDLREVVEIKPIAGGFSKHTIGLQLRDAEGKVDDLVIRKVAPGRVADTFPNEYEVLVHVAESGLAVPPPVWFDATGGELGSPLFVTRRVSGEVVGDVTGASNGIDARIVRNLATLVAELHRIPPGSVTAPRPPMVRPDDLLAAIEDREIIATKALTAVPGAVGAELYYPLFAWLRANVPSLPGGGVLVHGDIGFHNTLVDGTSITALLDWEMSHLGHPAEDLAYLRPSIEPLMPWPEFVEVYRAAGGAEVSDADLHFFSVWQDVWRATSCLRLLAKFIDRPDTLSDAISGLIHRPRFLDSAVRQALKGL